MLMLKKPVVWGVAAVFALSVAAGLYINKSSQNKTYEQARLMLDSGITLFNEKKHEEAFQALESIPKGSDFEWQARYYQGSALIMQKDYEAALDYLERALEVAPTEARIMHALGVAYFKLGKLDLAKAYYAAVLEINPEDEEAKGLMEIMANLQRRSEAEQQVPDEDAGGD